MLPELMLYVAFKQFKDAGEVSKMMNRSLRIKRKNSLEPDHHGSSVSLDDHTRHPEPEWTRRQGFYVGMGGLCFDITDQQSPFIEKEPKGWVDGSRKRQYALTVPGFKFLIAYFPELVPSISMDDLDDRSNTNALGKTITLLQALWFFAQITMRLVEGLPISLLELNTLGHAFCALIMFLFWWHKPYDMGQSLVIEGEEKLQVLAYLSLCRDIYGKGAAKFPHDLMSLTDDDSENWSVDTDIWNGGTIVLKPKHYLPGTGLRNDEEADIKMNPETVRRSQLAWQCWLSRGGSAEDKYEKKIVDQARSCSLVTMDRLPIIRSKKFWKEHGEYGFITVIFVSTIYGGIHTLASNAPFQSHMESHLWFAAAIIVCAGAMGSISLSVYIYILVEEGGRFFFFYVVSILGLSIYLVARAYLVVESFVWLRQAPQGIYQLPQYIQYIQ